MGEKGAHTCSSVFSSNLLDEGPTITTSFRKTRIQRASPSSLTPELEIRAGESRSRSGEKRILGTHKELPVS